METHSSILAWRIPWTEEPGRLQSMGSQELDMTATKSPPSSLDTMSVVFTSLSSAPWTVPAQHVIRVPNDMWKQDLNLMGFEVVVAQLFSLVWFFATWWTAPARLPWSSLSHRVYSNSYPLSQWCHLTISPSVTPFSFCLQSFPESGSFPMSQLFASGDQSIGTSASASVLPMNIQGWFPFRLTSLILQSKGLSRVFSSTTVWKHQFFGAQPSVWNWPTTTTVTSMHDYWKNHSFDYTDLCHGTRCHDLFQCWVLSFFTILSHPHQEIF